MTVVIPVFYCIRTRCVKKEKQEPNSTRLTFIKKWRIEGRGRVWMETGLFECPKCKKRYRKHIRSGREQTQ